MIYATATVPVNPAGEEPLTREQVWKGLVLKARNATQFLPPGFCDKCEVVQEGKDFIVREAIIFKESLTEIVTFEPMTKVSFHQFKGPREGVIVNELIDDAGGALHLRFYCLLGLRGITPDGPEEQQEKARMSSEDKGYKSALLSTLARTRTLVREGKI
ncbi:DUF1857 family protein [Terriglobus albidus]|uniref:DUF1857 family protein n=1 Tax=Terriglobus albidus TaxID=1592106 RepID=A0A5B9EF83_9BACT|nr:AtaL-like protein [Terriglobus albidus]QEE30722.1 DUF1857 family protein [Terriglobus albidus]